MQEDRQAEREDNDVRVDQRPVPPGGTEHRDTDDDPREDVEDNGSEEAEFGGLSFDEFRAELDHADRHSPECPEAPPVVPEPRGPSRRPGDEQQSEGWQEFGGHRLLEAGDEGSDTGAEIGRRHAGVPALEEGEGEHVDQPHQHRTDPVGTDHAKVPRSTVACRSAHGPATGGGEKPLPNGSNHDFTFLKALPAGGEPIGMRRRRFVLACAGGIAGLAGCREGSAPATETTPQPVVSEPRSSPGTPTTTRSTASPSLAVAGVRLQPAVVLLTTPDSIGVHGRAGRQYLFLDVTRPSGRGPDRDAIELRFDGTAYRPGMDGVQLWRSYTDDPRYSAGRDGWIVFDLPMPGPAPELALTWSGNTLPIAAWGGVDADALRTRLTRPEPRLAVSFDPPSVARPGSSPALGFTVRNLGDRPTRFVGALNREGPRIASTPIAGLSRLVPPAGTRQWSVRDTVGIDRPPTTTPGGATATVTYSFSWPAGETRAEVPLGVEGSPTASGTGDR